ncbi:MAG: hypothetical protein CMK37_08320 [Porticoccaceae bacterium]|nr:hypothetical protein [Porticoccaceae bacterium]|tara:strand:- start:6304 stop:7050 length:747 start_codon:yes stop_codon:yes gene_type:complete
MKKHNAIIINSELAQAILDNRPENKTLQQQIVDQYSAAMKSGEWNKKDGIIILSERSIEEPFTASSIESISDLRLCDGHHRLSAIIKSETEQEFEVITLEDSDWQAVYDNFETCPMTSFNASVVYFRLSDLEELDLEKFIKENTFLHDSALWARDKERTFFETEQKRSLLRKRFILAFLHFTLSGENLQNSDLAEEFLKKLIGETADVEEDILSLRELSLEGENDDYIDRLNQILTGGQIWMSLKQES